jgi:hypothetical protein
MCPSDPATNLLTKILATTIQATTLANSDSAVWIGGRFGINLLADGCQPAPMYSD